MKSLLVLSISLLFIAGCSSKGKKGEGTTAKDGAKQEASADSKADGKTSSATSASKSTCMMKNDKRVIDVRTQNKGCELAYTKFGNEEVVATSMNGTDHCQKIADRIKGNLENAGFKCE